MGNERARKNGRLFRGAMVAALATTAVSAVGLHALTPAASATPTPVVDVPQLDVPLLDVIGHRAGFAARPENTMSAIKHAVKLGADAVELDVVFTKDGGKAVFHDLTLDRTTTCTGRVDALTWKKLRKCDAGIKAGPQFAGERIPSLNQALRALKKSDLTVYIHVRDTKNAAQAASILRAVKNNGMNNSRTVIFAGKGKVLRKLDGAGAKPRNMGQLFTDPKGWDAPYKTLVPYRTPITRELVDAAHAKGKKVVAVENYPLDLTKLDGLGLDGYMANDLAGALNILR